MEETRPTRDRARWRRVRPVDTGASVTAGGQGRNHGAEAAAQEIFITKSWGRTASTLSKSSKEFDCVRERIKGRILSLKKNKTEQNNKRFKTAATKEKSWISPDVWHVTTCAIVLFSRQCWEGWVQTRKTDIWTDSELGIFQFHVKGKPWANASRSAQYLHKLNKP